MVAGLRGAVAQFGRAPESHSGGRRFDPVQLHHYRRPAALALTRWNAPASHIADLLPFGYSRRLSAMSSSAARVNPRPLRGRDRGEAHRRLAMIPLDRRVSPDQRGTASPLPAGEAGAKRRVRGSSASSYAPTSQTSSASVTREDFPRCLLRGSPFRFDAERRLWGQIFVIHRAVRSVRKCRRLSATETVRKPRAPAVPLIEGQSCGVSRHRSRGRGGGAASVFSSVQPSARGCVSSSGS